VLDPDVVLPAPGQGALAVECRSDDRDLRASIALIDDADARSAVAAERALLAALEAGCTAPVGALAEVVEGEDGAELSLRAFVGAPDGSAEVRRSLVAPVADPVAAGRRLATLLLEDGAADLALSESPEPDASRPPGNVRLAEPPDGIPRPLSTLTTNHQHHTEQVS
jgi:hydroxymethylbilane synthase